MTIVPVDLLEALAAHVPTVSDNGHQGGRADRFDLERWLAEHQLSVVAAGEWQGGRKFVLNPCPWNPEHTNRSAFVLQFSSGAIAAGCHHNGCSGNDWRGLRERYEPGRGASARRITASGPVEPIGDYRLTDTGNAARFAVMHGEIVRHVAQWGRWFVWDGTRWPHDDTGEVVRLARVTNASIYREAADEPDEMRRKALSQHAVRSESDPKIRAMLHLAESEPGIAIRAQDFDRDPWTLNVANGTIDLRTGTLRAHRREDLLTKLAPVEFDPQATCPMFDAFLQRIMDHSKQLIAYLQRAIGSALAGVVLEHVLFVLYGLGANGKSTLLNLILRLLGNYAKRAAPGLLMRKYGDTHPTEIADLYGARFVASIEVEEGKRLAEVLTKELTGGDRLKARRMREDFWEFDPTFKLFLAVNHKPTIRGTDEAIWRRIREVPFTISIPKAEQDTRLLEKLIGEGPGILNWMLRGCLCWQGDGLKDPPEVEAATEEYRAEMDVLGDFLTECVCADRLGSVTAKILYAGYTKWCEENGEKPVSQKRLGSSLSERGFVRRRDREGIVWDGLVLPVGDL